MKKRKIAIALIVLLIMSICVSCGEKVQYQQNESGNTCVSQIAVETEGHSQEIIKDSIEIDIVYDRNETPNGYCEVYENKLIYKNEELRYKIVLPISWKDNFRVEKSEFNWLFFYFWGESDACYSTKTQERVGLRAFLIANENDFDPSMLDSIYYLGTANGVKYYFAKNTDCPICALYDEINDYENGVSIYQDNPEQIELIKEDIRVMEKMKDDLDNIDLDFQPME